MRKSFPAVFAALMMFALGTRAQQEISVAEAARKAREQRKNAPKATKVFTNDDLAAISSAISVIGVPAAPPPQDTKPPAAPSAKQTPEKKEAKSETYWRTRFAEARRKLRDAEKELDILQRELSLKQVQYYSNPNEALQQQYTRGDINQQRQKIEEKQKEAQDLRQALSDLENELRRAGGDPSWARE